MCRSCRQCIPNVCGDMRRWDTKFNIQIRNPSANPKRCIPEAVHPQVVGSDRGPPTTSGCTVPEVWSLERLDLKARTCDSYDQMSLPILGKRVKQSPGESSREPAKSGTAQVENYLTQLEPVCL